jgi:signal peptidase I
MTNEGQARQAPVAKKGILREYGEALIIAIILALVIRAFVVQAFSIPSGSMEPTLLIGDYLLVNKFSYGLRNPLTNKVIFPLGKPQRGDVVVFIYPKDPTKDYIKRVVAVPGDRVEIRNKLVYINGQMTETPQAVHTDPAIIPRPTGPMDPPRDNFGPVVAPPDAYFVLGDNRDYSFDSRFWGFVTMDALRGKAFIIYFSWAGDRGGPIFKSFLEGLTGLVYHFTWDTKKFRLRWDRFGKLIN